MYAFNTHPGYFCPSFHFLFMQSLKVSPRWALRTFSGLFWACAQPWLSHGLLYSQDYVRASQNTPGTSHSPAFPLRALISPSYAPTVTAASDSCNVKQLPLIIFDKCLGEKAALASGVSPGTSGRGKYRQLHEEWGLKELHTHSDQRPDTYYLSAS